MRVCGERCGLRRQGFGALKDRVLSLGADSLCESAPVIWVEVREWFFINSLKSMGYLRTDRASFNVALVGKSYLEFDSFSTWLCRFVTVNFAVLRSYTGQALDESSPS